ncbi:hypothetical protein B0J14DRAFT_688818 [Halenospora varia]|nr:hypothetical protein B0J14DRAFT_688818 [Halenospora varia]
MNALMPRLLKSTVTTWSTPEGKKCAAFSMYQWGKAPTEVVCLETIWHTLGHLEQQSVVDKTLRAISSLESRSPKGEPIANFPGGGSVLEDLISMIGGRAKQEGLMVKEGPTASAMVQPLEDGCGILVKFPWLDFHDIHLSMVELDSLARDAKFCHFSPSNILVRAHIDPQSGKRIWLLVTILGCERAGFYPFPYIYHSSHGNPEIQGSFPSWFRLTEKDVFSLALITSKLLAKLQSLLEHNTKSLRRINETSRSLSNASQNVLPATAQDGDLYYEGPASQDSGSLPVSSDSPQIERVSSLTMYDHSSTLQPMAYEAIERQDNLDTQPILDALQAPLGVAMQEGPPGVVPTVRNVIPQPLALGIFQYNPSNLSTDPPVTVKDQDNMLIAACTEKEPASFDNDDHDTPPSAMRQGQELATTIQR